MIDSFAWWFAGHIIALCALFRFLDWLSSEERHERDFQRRVRIVRKFIREDW